MELETASATSAAAQILVEHLFAQSDASIPGLSYAVTYKLAEGHAGGDIIDIYHFDNDSVAISIADIAGKGTQAAVHAALIKYGLRAYASQGLTPERVVRALDRLYLENNAFERTESFASLFIGIVDPSRRMMTYACAAHEPVLVMQPNGEVTILRPTAPLSSTLIRPSRKSSRRSWGMPWTFAAADVATTSPSSPHAFTKIDLRGFYPTETGVPRDIA